MNQSETSAETSAETVARIDVEDLDSELLGQMLSEYPTLCPCATITPYHPEEDA
jgi:hypothetical protein